MSEKEGDCRSNSRIREEKAAEQKLAICSGQKVSSITAQITEILRELKERNPSGIPHSNVAGFVTDALLYGVQYVPPTDLRVFVEGLFRSLANMDKSCEPVYQRSRDLAQKLALATRIEYQLKAIMSAKDLCLKGKIDFARHGERAAWYAKTLAEELGLSEEDVKKAYLVGSLHDLGKIGVPDAILTKPARLNDNEWVYIREHPVVGAKIIKRFDSGLDYVVIAVEQHHENWGGSGYPKGLKGTQIHIFARLARLVDTFDAMTSRRPYEEHQKTLESAVREIAENENHQFDPEIAKHAHCLKEPYRRLVA